MSAHAALDAIRDTVRSSTRVAIRGGGTKSSRAPGDAALLAMHGHAGLIEYAPDECVLTAWAGTPLSALIDELARHGQCLPFDPPLHAEGATLGGVIACGTSGPGRYRYGGVRDFVIGVRIVDGEGRVIRSGGKVVKNAAGFLLHHAMVGSWGRFGVLVEASLKVFPAPEAQHRMLVRCNSVEDALLAAQQVEAAGTDCAAIDFDAQGRVSVVIAGRAQSVGARARQLADRLRAVGRTADDDADDPLGMRFPDTRTTCVRVGAVGRHWRQLAPQVSAARFMCAGRLAWLWPHDLDACAQVLAAAGAGGVVITGPHAGRRVGRAPRDLFEERVRGVLDPGGRFDAAPDSDR